MARLTDRIAAANAGALDRLARSAPVLSGVRDARALVPALSGRTLLHAGPPIAPAALCGPMRGAVLGAALLEGWADTADEAARLLDSGAITLLCAHDHGAVGPMAGIISPTMPLLEVRDAPSGTVACSPINEGIGAVLRFGAYDPAVLEHLRWIRAVLGPAIDAALQKLGGLPLIPLMTRALAMGDEMHQRNIAATALFVRALAPHLVEAELPAATAAAVLRFLADNDQFFLNVAMAACKCVADGLRDIPYCTVVTAMSRNGVEFGLRVSGLGAAWFTAPAPVPDGLYFPGYGAADANPDMGDSAIVETVGLGGMAMAASPAVAGFVGLRSAQDALLTTTRMSEITVGPNPHFKIPALDFAGTPTGIDIRRVVELETEPVINTGIAHRRGGVGQIGAGVARAPLACFQQALAAFAERYAT
ncbi:MAG: DUF1116 domain-containing protein [Bacillati bacterium ANGP1]|uniref:DUF1116 domain-containing protein n=1 Tax=Candidatus Segetimicrobium genomatis TaxID=2569760 RepID=A0A537IHZ7_9BACT|nr:MAG: DUF1116 domain-containing protein [Terrabacteria group bacterium ANGP1]